MSRALQGADRLVSSNLLEAELLAALRREGVAATGQELLSWIAWVFPDRPLTAEFDRALRHGRLRGADLWHVGCALFLANDPSEMGFITLDHRQRDVAAALGFRVG